MKKKGNVDLDKLNQSLLNGNQKTIKNIDTLTSDTAMKKSEKKLHKTVVKLFGRQAKNEKEFI